MNQNKLIWLSHTGLEAMRRCPRCFWLQYKKRVRQPEGIVSRLANRFDGVLKNYFNLYRPSGELPPMIEDKLTGRLQNPFIEKYWVRLNNHYGFWGKLDECLILNENLHVPIDFKTSSSDPRQQEILPAYQSQIDDYLFILENNNKKTAGYGCLIYVYPDTGKSLHKGFPMIIHVVKLKGNPQNTKKRLNQAIKILEKTIPKPSSHCQFCQYVTLLTSEDYSL